MGKGVPGGVSAARTRIMRAIRSESAAERRWRSALGLPRGRILGVQVDAVDRQMLVAYFYDSCFWHGCPDHFVPPRTRRAWWLRKIVRNAERDAQQTEWLESAGWAVVRVWGHEAVTA